MTVLTTWLWTCSVFLGVGEVTGQFGREYNQGASLASSEVTTCGSYLNNSHGNIKTPNFPREFPLPISCQWLLHAPPGKKIVLYFTQYYMRQSLHLIEYDYYESVHNNRGRHDLGEVSFEVSSYTVYKPYLLLRFEVEEAGNIHLRVHQFLLDVYGFNITYEMVGDNDDLRPDDCFKHKCSFLGNCLASHDFSKYQCHCFSGYFGEECQYGPFCDPDKGINMCKNGGKCRYFYGSLVNTCECPPAFEGVQCETKKEGYNMSDSHCDKLDCEQRCISAQEGQYHCECEEGFRLASDLKTCKEKVNGCVYSCNRRGAYDDTSWSPCSHCVSVTLYQCDSSFRGQAGMRYFAQVRFFTPPGNEEDQLCDQFRKEFSSKVQDVMVFVGVQFIEKVSIANITPKDGYWYVDFVFMGDKSENRNIWFLVDILVANTTICGSFVADKTYIMRDAKPALHSMTLKNYDNKSVKEGDILTLVCEAKGSGNLQFEWYKDGAPINVSITLRNMYVMTIPKANPETRTSVLDIDKANRLDAGVFTCKATDWNETKERNLTVEVLKPPQVEVKPLSKAITPGGVAVFVCLSTEDKRGTFRYTWYRGDHEILHGAGDNEELAEELLPAGSRMTIRNARKTLTYTCIVESDSGKAEDKVTLMVVEGLSDTYFCKEEVFNGIMWPQTPCGSSSLQRCVPRGYSKAVRHCECENGDGRWVVADMTSCTSSELETLKDEVDSLELGYLSNTTGKLLDELDKFLRTQDTAKPMMGDLQLACHLLSRLQDHARKHHAIEAQSASNVDILRLASTLLERTQLGSHVEKKGNLGTCILHLMELIRKDRRMQANLTLLSPSKRITTKMLDVKVQYIGDGNSTIFTDDAVTIRLDTDTPSPDGNIKRRSIQPVVHRTFNGSIIAVTYKDSADFLSTESQGTRQMALNSVAVMSGPVWNNVEQDLQNDINAPFVVITFHHINSLARIIENASYCLRWQFEGNTGGSWSYDGCQVIAVQKTLTRCRCQTPGHFVVAQSTHLDAFEISETNGQAFDVTVIGCVICLFCCLATLLIRLAVWSESQPVLRLIVVNLCCTLIMLNTVLITGFHASSHKMLCRWVLLLLAFAYLAAFSFLLMEAVYLFTRNVKRILYVTAAMITVVGWGPPILVFLVFITVSYTVDRPEAAVSFCWLLRGRWHLEAFIALASIYFLAYCALLLVLVRDACSRAKADNVNINKKYIFYIIRSGLLTILLTFSCALSIVVANSDTQTSKCIFSTVMAILGVKFLIFHGILYIKKCSAVISKCQKECLEAIAMKDQTARQNSATCESIKTISNSSTKLPKGGLVVSADEDPDDPYVRDRKYTKEHKEHLKSLLGTGSSEVEATRKSSQGSPNNSLTRSTIVTVGTGEDDEGSTSSTVSSRPVANPKCACTRCGTALPYKPARGRAYISDQRLNDAPNEPLLFGRASAHPSLKKTSDQKAAKTVDAQVTSPKSPSPSSSKKDVSYSPVKGNQI